MLAVHGITASSRAWAAVARALPEGWALVAVDLRGRGGSRELPGPTGLARHVDDLERVVAHLDPAGSGELVLTGHSLGAYVALLLAEDSPQRFPRLVLVDGGIPLPVPEDVDLDDLLQATLGPALTRLSQTFDDAESLRRPLPPAPGAGAALERRRRDLRALRRAGDSPTGSGPARSRKPSGSTVVTCSAWDSTWTARCGG